MPPPRVKAGQGEILPRNRRSIPRGHGSPRGARHSAMRRFSAGSGASSTSRSRGSTHRRNRGSCLRHQCAGKRRCVLNLRGHSSSPRDPILDAFGHLRHRASRQARDRRSAIRLGKLRNRHRTHVLRDADRARPTHGGATLPTPPPRRVGGSHVQGTGSARGARPRARTQWPR